MIRFCFWGSLAGTPLSLVPSADATARLSSAGEVGAMPRRQATGPLQPAMASGHAQILVSKGSAMTGVKTGVLRRLDPQAQVGSPVLFQLELH